MLKYSAHYDLWKAIHEPAARYIQHYYVSHLKILMTVDMLDIYVVARLSHTSQTADV